MKKTILLVLILAVLFGMSAFAGGQQEAGGGEASAEAAAEFGIEAPAQSVSIDMIGWAFPITEFYAEELEKLNAVQNLKVNTQLLDSASAQEQVRLALSGGKKSPYAIVHAANAQISEWGYSDWLLPLDDLIEKYWDEYDLGDIPQTAWDAATVDGKIVGIPMASNTLHLMYREDLLEKHGLEVPTTYDEVIEVSQALAENEPSIDVPFTMNLHAGWAWETEFLHFVRAFGGDFINDDNTVAFNGSAGVKALEKMKEVADKAMGQSGMSYSIDDSEVGLQTGRLAMAQIWASRAANMDDPDVSAYPDEIKFAPAAAPTAGGPLGGSTWNDFYCIPKNTEVDHELIFKVIMEAVDLESQEEAAGYGIPTRMKAVQSEDADAYMPAAMETIAKGVGAYKNLPGTSLARTALGEFLPLVGTGELSPQEALDKAAAKYTEEAKANGFID
ncbi:MAG: ABC transporter substrate-binding protein [Spirochaetia bacterium]